jgi:hypothetical protein
MSGATPKRFTSYTLCGTWERSNASHTYSRTAKDKRGRRSRAAHESTSSGSVSQVPERSSRTTASRRRGSATRGVPTPPSPEALGSAATIVLPFDERVSLGVVRRSWSLSLVSARSGSPRCRGSVRPVLVYDVPAVATPEHGARRLDVLVMQAWANLSTNSRRSARIGWAPVTPHRSSSRRARCRLVVVPREVGGQPRGGRASATEAHSGRPASEIGWRPVLTPHARLATKPSRQLR